MEVLLGSCVKEAATTFQDSNDLISIKDYFRILRDLNFELIYDEPFTGENTVERLYVLFNYERSILLRFDTYTYPDNEIVINSSKMYFNWICSDPSRISFIKKLSKIEFKLIDEEFVWIGEEDALRDLRKKLQLFCEIGFFIEWKVNPRFSLLNYSENLLHLNENNMYRLNNLPNRVLGQIAL